MLVLMLYPLSTQYLSLLEAKLGEKPTYILVSDLRHKGVGSLLRHLAKSRYHRVILPYEVPEGASTLSILRLLGAAHKFPQLEVCDPSGDLRPIRLWEILYGAVGLLGATVCGQVARWRSFYGSWRNSRRRLKPCIFQKGAQRVLYLKNNLWFGLRAGGSVGHVAGVINAFIMRGNDVCFVSPEEPKYLSPEVRIARVPLFRHYGIPAEANLFRLQELTLTAASKAAAEFEPTLIYQRLSLGDWTGAELARRLGLPLVVEYNGSELWVARNWGSNVRYSREMMAAEEALLRSADLIFTVSQQLHDELVTRGFAEKRVAWYPNCVDPLIYDPGRIGKMAQLAARERMGAAETDFVIMFVGTFGLWHGAELFAKAAALLCASKNWIEKNRVRFAFIGDGRTRANCETIIRLSPALEYTAFTGLIPQHETPAFLAAADAFVAPHVPNADGSPFFGSPTKLFEYMAMARPIVASKLDQISEILDDRRTAVMVTPGDIESLASGLRYVVENRAFGSKIGNAARCEVLRKYSWEHHLKAILAALAKAAGGPESGLENND